MRTAWMTCLIVFGWGQSLSLTAAGQETPPATPPAQSEASVEPAPAEQALPRLQQMQSPTTAELLTGPRRDWVVLKTEEVIVAEPVYPRPATVATMEKLLDEKQKERFGLTGEALAAYEAELEDMKHLYLTIPGDEQPEYRIPLTRVSRVIHHEDLMLERIRQSLAAEEFDSAMELLLRLERSTPDWPGLRESHDAILFTEANSRLQNDEAETALVYLEELRQRTPAYGGIVDLAGKAVAQLAGPAMQAGDYPRAHHFLLRLSKFASDHPVAGQIRSQLGSLAQQALDEAQQVSARGDHALAAVHAERAASIWPPLPALKAIHRTLTERWPRVHVGVVRLAVEGAAPEFGGRAERRTHRLRTTPLFEPSRYKGGSIYYHTGFFDEWEPFDLGRRVRIRLSDARQPSEVDARLDAATLARMLRHCIDPAHPDYDERLASFLSAVDVDSPLELTLSFSRVPSRIEPLLADLTVVRATAAAPAAGLSADGFESSPALPGETAASEPSGGDPSADASSGSASSGVSEPAEAAPPRVAFNAAGGGFLEFERTTDAVVYRRPVAEPEKLKVYHTAEIVEHLYATDDHAVRAMQSGDVSVLVDMPDWIVRRLQADEAFTKQCFILPLAVPATHVLQFNPECRALRVREIRRCLEYAIDRRKILAEDVLRDPALTHGRLSFGPFSLGSYANNPQVQTRPYDASTAIALLLAGRKLLGTELPPLRLAVPPDPVEQLAAKRIAASWKRIGVVAEIVDSTTLDPQSPLDGWDVRYRTIAGSEPVFDMWPFVAGQPRAFIADLRPFPDWLTQELIALDRTADWNRAVASVQTLHRRLAQEAVYIPLWELDEYVILRKTIRNFRPVPFHPYDGAEHWSQEAYYRATLE